MTLLLKKVLILSSIIFVSLGLSQCRKGELFIRSKGFIDDRSEWKILEACLTRRCSYFYDLLLNKDIQVGIKTRSEYRSKFNIIRIDFFSEKLNLFTFNPNSSKLAYLNKQTKGIAYKCSEVKVLYELKSIYCSQDDNRIQSLGASFVPKGKPYTGPVSLEKNKCFYLFFDIPHLTPDEEYSIKLGELFQDDKNLKIPEIFFKGDTFIIR